MQSYGIINARLDIHYYLPIETRCVFRQRTFFLTLLPAQFVAPLLFKHSFLTTLLKLPVVERD